MSELIGGKLPDNTWSAADSAFLLSLVSSS